jgi:hypothetical protein
MQDDLFEPIAVMPTISQKLIDDAVKKYSNYNRGFVWIAINQKYRDKINERWIKIKQFCETNFVTEFQDEKKFYSKLWELNLRYLFESQLTRKPGKGEPDLILNSLVIECGVPDPNGVPDIVLDGKLYSYPTDEIGRRVTKILTDKFSQFKNRRAENTSLINYGSMPYIIAVGLPQREFRDAKSMSGLDIVETMLIGAGPLQVTIDWADNSGEVSVSSRGTIQTRNGTDYNIAYFQKDEWMEISAVLWSSELIPEINDIKILLNPKAKTPLLLADLSSKIQIFSYTKANNNYVRDQKIT